MFVNAPPTSATAVASLVEESSDEVLLGADEGSDRSLASATGHKINIQDVQESLPNKLL